VEFRVALSCIALFVLELWKLVPTNPRFELGIFRSMRIARGY